MRGRIDKRYMMRDEVENHTDHGTRYVGNKVREFDDACVTSEVSKEA